jgi:hypothetical protein
MLSWPEVERLAYQQMADAEKKFPSADEYALMCDEKRKHDARERRADAEWPAALK